MSFPKNFVWGAAAASYQIEGAAYEDGKGLSAWDMFCRKPEAIWQGNTGDTACDHYHRYKNDVALMKSIGLQAYRFSISWPRVLPQGTGTVNPKGLEFYDNLVDELLAAGITPYITLFHWDYPYSLYLKGGWMNPDSSDWFAEYTNVIIDKLSDRVNHWMTFNEPRVFVGIGHEMGRHAPGISLDLPEVLRISHNVFLSHGKAVQTIRARAKTESRIGYVVDTGGTQVPASERPEDIEAARAAMFSVKDRNCMNSILWLEPVLAGRYPEEAADVYGSAMPEIGPDDMATIAQPLDFVGLNTYTGEYFQANADGEPEAVSYMPGHPRTAFNWPVVPEALYWGPKFIWDRYQVPIVIAENGLSNTDWVTLDGKVHDPQRIDYLTRYLQQFRKAGEDGVDIRGYFQWSIMDNFEWAYGYRERFGLIHVDFETQQRTLKDSAYWYKDVIASNGGNL
jgi:beta-glucosidase